ncbi:MAG: oxygen-dependent coproporphyrinogen oxidase [Candidatus Hydrogenedentes bacterium]|nr:oxygen-dependent coproporphyrinogen oxidase [Candidatus Hydrogenedentota bacterium]
MPGVDAIEAAFRDIQDRIARFLVEADGSAYREDRWSYEKGSGGGITRVWEGGPLIEKGGVNFSAIHGESLPASAATQFNIAPNTPFVATGVSLVIHPWNPHVPTIHLNVRYFEAGDLWWFGGGVDLTPYYPVREDVVAFHRALKQLCDACGEDYVTHKKACDEYFFIRHRDETRGVGGLFFDHLRHDKERHYEFVCALGNGFPSLYRPLIERHRDAPYTDAQRDFQCYRRSRYVEFNLVYDRGTLFGLQSGGRIESILMSMPAVAKWRYDWRPEPGTPEAELTEVYLKPQDWLDA